MRGVATTLIRCCSVCGKRLQVLLRADHTYRGGHYFGRLHANRGRRVEYWECPSCYRAPSMSKESPLVKQAVGEALADLKHKRYVTLKDYLRGKRSP